MKKKEDVKKCKKSRKGKKNRKLKKIELERERHSPPQRIRRTFLNLPNSIHP
jgi:hypothetical protein